jgi:hypothetical protein
VAAGVAEITGFVKSKAPQANQRLRGSETRGSFRPLQATRLGENATSAPTAAARESPGASGSLARTAPVAVVDPRICPHCAERRYAQEIGKKNPGQEWADRGVSLSARAAISVALATILHAELRARVNRRSAPRFVLVLKVG